MKKAIGYVRISTKDQSNFSLEGQEKNIRDFAARNDYEILNVFCDDGQSAKNFDRPDWKKLQLFCKNNHADVDALIVAKYDRFSRNLKDALTMIEMLEDKFNIRVLSAAEPIMMNSHSPYFFQFRTQMLMGAQVEWLIIKDRTKQGNYNAASAGRYLTTAPVGYVNKRDEQNKPIIEIDQVRAPVIRRMFQMFIEGANYSEIGIEARRLGLKNRSKGSVKYTLMNPVYAGMIKVPGYGDDPGGWLTKGIHEPIINLSTWEHVQELLDPRKTKRTVMNESVPLRGVLKCFCGRVLTAGNSKGRKRHYWYYRCDNHTSLNHNADRLHEQLEEIIDNLSLPLEHVEYLQEGLLNIVEELSSERKSLLQAKKRELAGLEIKLNSVEDKFISDNLEVGVYRKWKTKYQTEISLCHQSIAEFNGGSDSIMQLYRERLPLLSNLGFLYRKLQLHEKQALVRQLFNSSLYYQDHSYRTTYMLPVFESKAALLKEKRLLVFEQPILKIARNGNSAPDRT